MPTSYMRQINGQYVNMRTMLQADITQIIKPMKKGGFAGYATSPPVFDNIIKSITGDQVGNVQDALFSVPHN